MIVAPSSDKVLNPSFAHPKQVKLGLGEGIADT